MLTILLITAASEGYQSFGLEVQDYYLHLIHNLVNLIFIIRFPSSDREGLNKKRNKAIEICFFVIQNIGIIFFFFSLEYTFLSPDNSMALRIFMQCQIICPYALLAMSFSEKYFLREETEKEEDKTSPKNSILAETNNNLLPIFMANSFAYIRLAFPLADAPVLVILNNFVCFCLKITLIHRFIIHGVVVVINGENIKDYAELYRPVVLGNRKRTWMDSLRHHETSILKACTLFLILFDIGVISLLKICSW